MEISMAREKETKGAIRFGDGDGHNIYMKKDEVAKLGNPENLVVTVEAG